MASRATSTERKIIEEAFRNHIHFITKKLGLPDSMECARFLLSDKVIGAGDFEAVEEKSTAADRASTLCSILMKAGAIGIIKFLDGLADMDGPALTVGQTIIAKAVELGLSKWPGENSKIAMAVETGKWPEKIIPPALHSSVPSVGHGTQDSQKTGRSVTATLTHEPDNLTRHSSVPEPDDLSKKLRGRQPDDEEYDLSKKPRGMAVIINNFDFNGIMGKRDGSEKDGDDLKIAFEKFHFDVKTHRNKKAEEMKDILMKVSQEDHNEAGAFVCAVLTHGDKGVVFGVDGREVEYDKIVKPFNRDNCKSLAGKPKLFFIQACRGRNDDKIQRDGPQHWTEIWPLEADILIAFSTTSNYVSYRDDCTGSYFIQALCKVFKDHPEKELQHMLIRVNREVASRMDGNGMIYLKQMPSIVNQLTRELRFVSTNEGASLCIVL